MKIVNKVNSVFSSLEKQSQEVLESFDVIVQGVQPLNSKQLRLLPSSIRTLSHELTDDRASRKSGYMNEAARLSAYTRYFMWWNLFRLTSVFAALPKNAFAFLKDSDYCLDIGSGPLTVPIALYLARPELREKKLTWYCVDMSHNALLLGENIFLSLVARLEGEPWNIVRIKGEIGVPIKNKASLLCCANMFNELFWNTNKPLEEIAKKYGNTLFSYLKKDAMLFVAEPGIPRAARFVSLLRDILLRKGHTVLSPCTHTEACPMDGRKGQKWCHFILDGNTAPKALQKLSTLAGLTKDRASISFVFATTKKTQEKTKKAFRIISDSIIIPFGEKKIKKKGRYACAPWGLTLAMEGKVQYASGDEIEHNLTKSDISKLQIDAKTKAKIVY